MSAKTLFVLTVVVAVGTTGGNYATADEYLNFLDKYAKHHHAATEHLWWNIKVSGTRARFDHSNMPPGALTVDRFTVVANDAKFIYQTVSEGRGKHVGKNSKNGGMLNRDAHFDVGYKDDGSASVVSELTLPWDTKHHELYYITYTGIYTPLNWPFYRLYIGRGPNRYYRPDPITDAGSIAVVPRSTFSVRNAARNGTDCIVVRQESPNRERPQDYIYYLDPRTYFVIAHEQIGMPQMNTRQVEPIRKVVEISYGPPAADTGLPFPTAVKTTYHMPDGKQHPGESVTFTEYRRYTPTADEVDVEKVLKVKMPAIPPRPPLPPEGQYLDPDRPGELLPAARRTGWSAWPWYAGGGVLAIAAIAAALRVRRSRRPVT